MLRPLVLRVVLAGCLHTHRSIATRSLSGMTFGQSHFLRQVGVSQGCPARVVTVTPSTSSLPVCFQSSSAAETEHVPGSGAAGNKKELSHDELVALLQSGDIQLIDVREPKEVEAGHIPNSINIPLSHLKESLQMEDENFFEKYQVCKPDPSCPNLVFYGLSSVKGVTALEIAHKRGYKKSPYYHSIYWKSSVSGVTYSSGGDEHTHTKKYIFLHEYVGNLAEALNLSPTQFEALYKRPQPQAEDTNIVLHCLAGVRSLKALGIAMELGYDKARHYPGGYSEWSSRH